MDSLEEELKSEIKDIPEEDIKEKLSIILKKHNVDFDELDDDCYPGGFRVIKGDEHYGDILFEIFTTIEYKENDWDEFYTFKIKKRK